jgi:hypothetical protein
MNRIPLGRTQQLGGTHGVVDLAMDDYDMDDLAGEIARTLAACQDLADDTSLTGNDGGEIAAAR